MATRRSLLRPARRPSAAAYRRSWRHAARGSRGRPPRGRKVFYGDSDNDITAAREAGARGIRVLRAANSSYKPGARLAGGGNIVIRVAIENLYLLRLQPLGLGILTYRRPRGGRPRDPRAACRQLLL
jgi:hypothetical protein